MKAQQVLLALSFRHNGDWMKMMNAITKHEYVSEDEVAELEKKDIGCKYITLIDDNYPQALRNISNPPFVLFYQGNLDLVSDFSKCVSYVGSRKSSAYGLNMARQLCMEMASDGLTVVSGLAYGIDTAAAKGALPFGKAVAVLGNGFHHYYPSENRSLQREMREHGLLLSEYPPDVAPSPDQFLHRNRIVAGLSIGVVVGEAKKHSGTNVTVHHALMHGREVMCIPFQADADSMCNLYIQDGAALILKKEDIYTQIKYSLNKSQPK